jgi:hypothetical protein
LLHSNGRRCRCIVVARVAAAEANTYHHKSRLVFEVDVQEQVHNLDRVLCIEVSSGFVQQHDLRFI